MLGSDLNDYYYITYDGKVKVEHLWVQFST
jgi:hypothetical protein